MSLFCSQCETINVDYASFCKNCGTKLNKEQNSSTNDNLSESERYFYNVDKSNIYIVLAFSLLIMFIFLVLSTNGRANNEQVETYSEPSNNVNTIEDSNFSNIENNVSANENNSLYGEPVKTRFGIITSSIEEDINENNGMSYPYIKFNGKAIEPKIYLYYGLSASIREKFSFFEKDVFLMNKGSGNACSGAFSFIAFSKNGIDNVTPAFGTCYDDFKVSQVGDEIIIVQKNIDNDNFTEYRYKNGFVYENGKKIIQDSVPIDLSLKLREEFRSGLHSSSNNEINKSAEIDIYSNGNFKEKAYQLMTGQKLQNESDIKIRNNSKGATIYCLKDMSVCKTEDEVNGVQNSTYNQNDSMKEKAHQLMTGQKLQNDSDIRVKKNSKGDTIYCLKDMSVCKTEDEVNNNYSQKEVSQDCAETLKLFKKTCEDDGMYCKTFEHYKMRCQ